MPYQAILAVVTGRDGDSAVLEAANIIARHFQSHIDVLFVGQLSHPIPCLNATVAPGFIGELVTNADADVRIRRDAAHKTFRLWMSRTALCNCDYNRVEQRSSLLTATWAEWAGNRREIGIRGRYADLIIMARPSSSLDAKSDLLLGGEAESALFESARPILFVPEEWTVFPTLENWTAMVAWNGSLEASRAVSYGLPFLTAAKSIKVFCGLEPEKSSTDFSQIADQFRRYLSLQAVHACFRDATISSMDAGKKILAEALACDAQLVVMGAFTRSRVRELILGGATEYVLFHARLPVLMAH
jgi:nucleotide-binding universal stress UspA family protein